MDFTSSSWDFIHETAICRIHSIYNDKMRWEEAYNADWRNDAILSNTTDLESHSPK